MFLKCSKRFLVLILTVLIQVEILHADNQNDDTGLRKLPEGLLPLRSFPMDPAEYATLTLDNGLVVIVVSDKNAKNSSISMTLPVGSFNEPVDEYDEYGGLAQLHKKTLLRTSKNFIDDVDFNQYIKEIGGESQFNVQGSLTSISLSAPQSFYTKMIDRLVDTINYPVFDSVQVKQQLMRLHSEWYQKKTSDQLLRQYLLTSCAGDNSINHFALGNLTTLKNNEQALIKALHDYHEKYYSANIMKVVMVSNQSLEDMAILAGKYFSTIKNKSVDIEQLYQRVNTENIGGHSVSIKPLNENNKLYINIPIKNFTPLHMNKLPVILNRILLDVQPGCAFRWLLENQLINDMAVEVQPWSGNQGFIELVVDLTASGITRKDEVISVIFDQLQLIRKTGISPEYQIELNQLLKIDSLLKKPREGLEFSEHIAVNMMFFGIENVLQSECLISEFNQQEYDEFLANITLDNLIIFHYDDMLTNTTKSKYFDAEYRFDSLNVASILDAKKEAVSLRMPTTNRYIPEQFVLANPMEPSSVPTRIDTVADIDTCYMSNKMADQPIGSINILFPSLTAFDVAELEVLQALLLRIAFERSETLIKHAKNAINNVSFYAGNGFRISVHGIPDKQPQIIVDLFAALKANNTQPDLDLVINDYVKSIEKKQKQALHKKILSDFDALKTGKEINHERLIEIAQSISAEKLNEFRKLLFANKPKLFFYGGYSKDKIDSVVLTVSEMLNKPDTVNSLLSVSNQKNPITFPNTYLIRKTSTTEKSAILDFYFDIDLNLQSKAEAIMLVMILKSTMYKERSMGINKFNVSLLYREFAGVAGIGFLTKGNNKSMSSLRNEINSFIKQSYMDLAQMNVQSFDAIKQEILLQIDKTIESLENDHNYHLVNWLYDFTEEQSRIAVIKHMKNVNLSDINRRFKRMFSNEKPSRINMQYLARDSKDKRFVDIENSTVLFDVSSKP